MVSLSVCLSGCGYFCTFAARLWQLQMLLLLCCLKCSCWLGRQVVEAWGERKGEGRPRRSIQRGGWEGRPVASRSGRLLPPRRARSLARDLNIGQRRRNNINAREWVLFLTGVTVSWPWGNSWWISRELEEEWWFLGSRKNRKEKSSSWSSSSSYAERIPPNQWSWTKEVECE